MSEMPVSPGAMPEQHTPYDATPDPVPAAAAADPSPSPSPFFDADTPSTPPSTTPSANVWSCLQTMWTQTNNNHAIQSRLLDILEQATCGVQSVPVENHQHTHHNCTRASRAFMVYLGDQQLAQVDHAVLRPGHTHDVSIPWCRRCDFRGMSLHELYVEWRVFADHNADVADEITSEEELACVLQAYGFIVGFKPTRTTQRYVFGIHRRDGGFFDF